MLVLMLAVFVIIGIVALITAVVFTQGAILVIAGSALAAVLPFMCDVFLLFIALRIIRYVFSKRR